MKKNHKADYALKAQAMKTKASFCQSGYARQTMA
jgi:hypothetical protein